MEGLCLTRGLDMRLVPSEKGWQERGSAGLKGVAEQAATWRYRG